VYNNILCSVHEHSWLRFCLAVDTSELTERGHDGRYRARWGGDITFTSHFLQDIAKDHIHHYLQLVAQKELSNLVLKSSYLITTTFTIVLLQERAQSNARKSLNQKAI
jgi:hypothetical protein